MKLDLSDFAYITFEMKQLANRHAQGRLVSVLEGGYNIEALRQCVQVHVLELMKP
jgi:acetoin utilization deacetylase AcuC-like enzyme